MEKDGMGFIGAWIMGKLKWLLVLAAIFGPVSAYIGWTDVDRVNDVLAKGVEGDARIVSATRKKGRRSGTSYYVDLAWKDAAGADRTADEIRVSNAMARTLFRDDRIIVDRVKIKYLPDERSKAGVVLVDDAKEEIELDRFMMYGGAAIGAIGLLGCAFMFGLFSRLRSRPKEEFARDGRAVMGPPGT
jgi:hypothetical protein